MKKKILIFAAVFFTLFLASCTTSNAKTGNLAVKVTSSEGDLLQGAKVVSNEQPAGQLKVSGLTDNTGMVTFNDIKSGDYDFYISRFDYEQKDFEVTVTAGKTTQYTAKLTATATPTPTK
jgi:hypothetical protein